jgi:hypothetical protein
MKPKLTFANVVAVIALFISLSGTVYAAAKIDGRTIRKGSIPANRVKPESLTGAQVNESALGTVPSAAKAQEAVRAESAERVRIAGSADSAARAETAATASKATLATEAGHATAADLASRADEIANFGGGPPSSYRRACEDGAIKGFLQFNPVADQKLDEYNCAGGAVIIVRLAAGRYEVTFQNLRNADMAMVATRGLNTAGTAEHTAGSETFEVEPLSTNSGDRLTEEPFTITVF